MRCPECGHIFGAPRTPEQLREWEEQRKLIEAENVRFAQQHTGDEIRSLRRDIRYELAMLLDDLDGKRVVGAKKLRERLELMRQSYGKEDE